LLTVARNLVTDRARARAVRPAEVAEVGERSPVEGDHSESVVNTMVVLDALDQVSPEHREVLVQLYYRGRSVTEAAQELGIPPGTVKSRSYYALRALRAVMAGPEAEVAR
jgi:RNA polymerase sigma-70 factor (ECF subfamily)